MDNEEIYYKVPEEDLCYFVECQYVLGNLINNIDWTTYYKTVERARLDWQKRLFPSVPENTFVNWTELSLKAIEGGYEKI